MEREKEREGEREGENYFDPPLHQAMIMMEDRYMYDKDKRKKMMVRATNLMEELGQIDYIFSDKTGTLTRNEMVFRVCSVGHTVFGKVPDLRRIEEFDEEAYIEGIRDMEGDQVEMEMIGKDDEEYEQLVTETPSQATPRSVASPRSAVSVADDSKGNGDEVVIVDGEGGGKKGNAIEPDSDEHLLFLSFALCNTVVPAYVKNRDVIYQSSSPDEKALVLGAKRRGYVLVSRSADEVVISINGVEHTYEILAINEFTSERRKMSVLVRLPGGGGGGEGRIKLLLKGADEAVFPICVDRGESDVSKESQRKVDQFAENGLRTLIFAQRDVSEEEFSEWAEKHWNVARLADMDRKRLMLEAADLIEKEVTVIGTSGIEDRLQDAVPKTIDDLLRANIKVSYWFHTRSKRTYK